MRVFKRTGLLLGLGLGLWLSPVSGQQPSPTTLPLEPVSTTDMTAIAFPDLGLDERLWGACGQAGDRAALIASIDNSLRYLQSAEAVAAYRNYPVAEISRDRIYRSLQRFRQLLLSSQSASEFQQAVQREFTFYRSVGHDGQGSVSFTGYFEPTYLASRVPTAEYRYPLYSPPAGLSRWPLPHPTRLELEGSDGLQGSQGPLRGSELVWLRDRLEAFLVQVQGSARLQLTDGSTMSVGYAGRTEYPYTSIGRQLVDAGKFSLEELTLPLLLDYFKANPDELDLYLPRNQRFIFFEETYGRPATGSLGVPVTPMRSIATDKSIMPPGAIALIHAPLPRRDNTGAWATSTSPTSRYVLDQDTGSAIRGPGRVDVFMGTGIEAGQQAGLVNGEGQVYYLLLKN